MPIATGHKHIIRAMMEEGLSRFITIATPAIRFEKDHTSLATVLPKVMASLFMPKPYKEIVAVGELTKSSGLDWTVVRFIAPVMNADFMNTKFTISTSRTELCTSNPLHG